MFYSITAVVTTIFIQLSGASPVATPASTDVNIPKSFPIFNLPAPSISLAITEALESRAIHDRALSPANPFPANIVTFSSPNCVGNATSFQLETLSAINTCFPQPAFSSVFVNQVSHEGLPFAIMVAPFGCASFAEIPHVNACFNLNGGPFLNFAAFQTGQN